MQKYKLIDQIGEGAFSIVLKAQSIKTGKEFAIKCMKNHFDSMDQVNNLREIQALRRLSPHPHIVQLLEVLYDEPTGRLALVFELMEKNLYEAIKGRRSHLAEQKVKGYMYQVLKAVYHMHKLGIFHRDIKPENILLVNDTVKLADLGSCRGIFSKQPYTEYISTRWYRAPECLLTDGYYSYKMDMWGFGCVFFEMLSLFPLFPGNDEPDQINKIHNILGTPPKEVLDKIKKYGSSHVDFNFPSKKGTGIAKLIPQVSPECIDLIEKLLQYHPDDRLSAKQALKHPYFKDLYEQDKRIQAQMNTGPSHTLRGHSQDYNSDNQSETPHNLSQHSNHININIHSTGSVASSNLNVNLNFGKKHHNKMLPDIKNSFHDKKGLYHSEESDADQSLPPISKYDASKKFYGPVNGPPKKYGGSKFPPSYSNDVTPNSYGPGKKLPFAPNKIHLQVTGQKKSYVSPYSQKAIIAHKQHYQ